MGTTVGTGFALKAPLSACTCRALCGYLAGQAWRLGAAGLQAPADALLVSGPTPRLFGEPPREPRPLPERDRRTEGATHTGVGGSPAPGLRGELSQQGGQRVAGQTAGLRWIHILPTCVSQIPRRVRSVALAGPLRAILEARCVGSRLPGQAWPLPALRGPCPDVGGRVPGPGAEVADRRPQAQGERDIARERGADPPSRPTAWVSGCAAAGQPLSRPLARFLPADGGRFQQGRLLGAILRGSPSAPRGQ